MTFSLERSQYYILPLVLIPVVMFIAYTKQSVPLSIMKYDQLM
jgi:hypothetical protein